MKSSLSTPIAETKRWRSSRQSFPAVRLFERGFTNFGDQRNWALDNTFPKHQWVLFVDADERMEELLAKEITRFVEQPQSHVGGYIAGRNYFMGTWLKRCTFYPSYQLRFVEERTSSIPA